jgi:hypothetical protein
MRTLTSFCFVALLGCGVSDEALSVASGELAGTDRLAAGEALFPNQSISSGSTTLVYQGDNNLVLYQGGSPIWASMAALGAATNQFAMQTDCNAVVYTSGGPVWASGTNGQGSSCIARVVEGNWFICSGTNRVFSARGGGDCGGGGGGGSGEQFFLSQMARIGGAGDPVAAYLVHMLKNTEITTLGRTRTLWDMIDRNKFMVALGNNGAGTDSYRVFFHYTGEGHAMISAAQHAGLIRYRNSSTGGVTHFFGFTQGGIFDPTLAHADMDHAYKSLFEESGKDLCLQPQWNDDSTVGEIDIDFHRQAEVIDHARPDNSDPLTTCSGGCKNNNATYRNAWGAPPGLPGYTGPMTVSNGTRGLIYDFHGQRSMPGYPEVAHVLAGRGIGVVTGVAVPR